MLRPTGQGTPPKHGTTMEPPTTPPNNAYIRSIAWLYARITMALVACPPVESQPRPTTKVIAPSPKLPLAKPLPPTKHTNPAHNNQIPLTSNGKKSNAKYYIQLVGEGPKSLSRRMASRLHFARGACWPRRREHLGTTKKSIGVCTTMTPLYPPTGLMRWLLRTHRTRPTPPLTSNPHVWRPVSRHIRAATASLPPPSSAACAWIGLQSLPRRPSRNGSIEYRRAPNIDIMPTLGPAKMLARAARCAT